MFPSITVHPCLFVEVFDTIKEVLQYSRYLVVSGSISCVGEQSLSSFLS